MTRETGERRERRFTLVPSPLASFMRTEAAGGAALLVATVIALIWANSGLSDTYVELWEHELSITVFGVTFDQNMREWVNSALMTVFFLVVGLEIKRELVTGELREPRAAVLPVAAAAGGMIVPALIYLAFNAGTDTADGWAIPVATDIAFAVGVVTLLGPRVPKSLKLFLLALAIADDIGGIVVIALFYSSDIAPSWLVAAAGAVAVIFAMRRAGIATSLAYVAPGTLLWVSLFQAGIEAAVTGVILGLATPAGRFGGRYVLRSLEHRLAPWSSFAVVPIFALANAGVVITADTIDAAVSSSVTIGVFLGLVVGKTVGVSLGTLAALRLRLGVLPSGTSLRQLVGVAALAGIGFTVALFIAELSFAGETLDEAKLGILAASLAAGVLGSLILRSGSHPEVPARAPRDTS